MIETGRERLAAFVRCSEHATTTIDRVRERLFTKDMLPGGERSEDSFFVKLRWSRNDDGVDLIQVKHFGDILAHSRSGRCGNPRRALLIDISDRDKFRAGDFG